MKIEKRLKLFLEASKGKENYPVSTYKIKRLTSKQILETAKFAMDEKLVNHIDVSSGDGDDYFIERITSKGQEKLESLTKKKKYFHLGFGLVLEQ